MSVIPLDLEAGWGEDSVIKTRKKKAGTEFIDLTETLFAVSAVEKWLLTLQRVFF